VAGWILPAHGTRRLLEGVDVTDPLPVRCHQQEIVGKKQLAVKVRLISVLPDVVGPANLSSLAVEGVEESAAGTDEEKVPRDRGGMGDSALRVEAPEQLGLLRRTGTRQAQYEDQQR
jgi:hypothetical protein